MTEFLRENIIFIAGAVLLTGLVAGASQLQQWHEGDAVHGSTDTSQPSLSTSAATGWHITSATPAPANTASPTAAPKASVPATPAPTRPRVYNQEYNDDN